MGRIADAVLSLLADGPAAPDELGAALARGGVTRARDPAAAVRRATRDDPRIIQIADGRLASVAGALAGLDLATVVTVEAAAAGAVEVEPDLAPLAMIGMGPAIELPPGIPAGETIAVRLVDPGRRRVTVRRLGGLSPRAADEAALLSAITERLSRWTPERPWAAPPVTHLATVAASVAALDAGALRAAGRPLSQVLSEAGYEVHLGWVGPRGTAWASLTDEEVAALEADAEELLAEERPAEAAVVQERLLEVVRRHLPERVGPARRRLARTLARAGRPAAALDALRVAFAEGDPEDWYEAAVIAVRSGDEVSARRWVEAGLARCAGEASEVAECLADIGGDLDAQAAFLRLRAGLADLGDEDGAERIAGAIVGPSRSYLVEAMAEEVLGAVAPRDVPPLLDALGEAGDAGREARIAVAVVLPAGAAPPGPPVRPRLAAVRGLVEARPARAWATSPHDAPDQQQVVIAVAKEDGRVAPLVALIDHDELGGGVKDAFFLPDMATPRLRREIFAPMEEVGLPNGEIGVDEAIEALRAALGTSARIGWRLPSLRHQPVLERMERWVLRSRPAGPGAAEAET
jgi:hypothetical protein